MRRVVLVAAFLAIAASAPPAAAATLADLRAEARQLADVADEFAGWRACIRRVPVAERLGYLYDDRDGTGLGTRSALALDRSPGSREATLDLLEFTGGPACRSDAKWPGPDFRARRTPIGRLRATVARLTRTARRFDRWESCVLPIPITEAGDPGRGFGFLFRPPGDRPPTHRAALVVDRSPWDDPDHFLLGFVHGERAGDGCTQDPSEAVDRRAAPAREQRALDAIAEDLEDLREPIRALSRFDQCMYTVGARQRPGYVRRDAEGRRTRASALAFDGAGPADPRLQLLAFPGEEPPSIECDEDAGEEDDDD